MQLHLTVDELELLKEMADNERRSTRDVVPSVALSSVQARLQDELRIGRDLAGKGLSRNLQLDFDELEDLSDSLTRHRNRLLKQIHCTADPEMKAELEHRLSILDHLLEKVTEERVML